MDRISRLLQFDDPTVGYFSNMELEIPFRVLDQEAVDMLDQTKAVQLELRFVAGFSLSRNSSR